MACVMHYVEGFHLLPAGFGMRMMCKIYVVMLTCAYVVHMARCVDYGDSPDAM
jgi:hypothetical protein